MPKSRQVVRWLGWQIGQLAKKLDGKVRERMREVQKRGSSGCVRSMVRSRA